jgi:hypothetical protein
VLATALLLGTSCVAPPPSAPPAAAEPAPSPPVEESWDRELASDVQLHCFASEGDGTKARIPIRIVDDATGDPIPGARIDNATEANWPHAEPWADLLWESVVTDRDGWALVESMNRAEWNFISAPGYGPLGEMMMRDEFRLARGVDVTIEVRDWRDRPVPGARVEALLGCGHTPTIQDVTAGADGRLVFRSIDPTFRTDLWVRTPGLAGRNGAYWGHGPGGFPEENGARILRGDPGPAIEGRVLRADGAPAAHAVVGTRSAHRGPWTVADADGRFRLVGAQPYDSITAVAPLSDPVPEGFDRPQIEFQSVPGVSATVRLPREGVRTRTKEEWEEVRRKAREEAEAVARGEEPEPVVPPEGPGIRVRVAAAPGVATHGRVRIVAVRDGDGATHFEVPRFKDGAASRAITAAPGTWTVTAGSTAGHLRPASRRVEVGTGWTDAAFVLDANPVWNPRVIDRGADGGETELTPPRAGTFYVTTDDGMVEATPHLDAAGEPDGSIHVPAAGPFAVEFRGDYCGRARIVLDGPPSGPGPALLLAPPAPEVERFDEDTRPREIPADRLVVLLPDGKPAAGAEVQVLSGVVSDGDPYRIRRGEDRGRTLDENGAAWCAFDRGDRVSVTVEGDDASTLLPLVARIEGPGPWTLRWPATEILVRAVDENGEPCPEFAVVLSGWDELDPVDGVVRLRGVGSGPLRLWVGAEGRRVHDLRLLVASGERREVVVRMTRATPVGGPQTDR